MVKFRILRGTQKQIGTVLSVKVYLTNSEFVNQKKGSRQARVGVQRWG